MLLRQFVDDDLGCASYLIGDRETGEAVLVDPAYEIEPYLAAAEEEGVRLTRVLETHTHADHVSGHGRLALEEGLPVAIHAAARPEFPFQPLADGDEVPVGSVSIRVLHTPGHRPEHCAFLAGNALLSGDSLFVGSVGRPDLAVDAREGAEGLFHSLRRLLELPDAVQVLPGHVAGSLCGAGMSGSPSSTLGQERRFNRSLAVSVMEEFVAESAAATAVPRPPTMDRVVGLNRGPFLGAQPPLRRLRGSGGATVLDVRPARAFAAGHVSGAINVPLSASSFATKAGFVLRTGEPVVLHAESSDEAELAARRLHSVGLLEVTGWLEDPDATERLEPLSIEELERLLERGSIDVIDVRESDERAEGYIAGSRHIPYRLVRACCDGLSCEKPVATVCESGARAAVAASILVANGVAARPVLDGGVGEWQARGGRTVEFRRCGSS